MPPNAPELPEWPPGTVAVLSTGADDPHAIPVSAFVRAGPRAVLLALAAGRESLRRLREDSRCALTLMAAGDVALTAHAHARVVSEDLAGTGVVAVLLDVDTIQDHGQPTFEILEGVRWRWTDGDAERRDMRVHQALRELADA